jgi:hypothetical protein
VLPRSALPLTSHSSRYAIVDGGTGLSIVWASLSPFW